MSLPRLKQGDIPMSHADANYSELGTDNSLIYPYAPTALNNDAKLCLCKATDKPNEQGNADWKAHSGTNRALCEMKRATSDGMIATRRQSSTTFAEANPTMCPAELRTISKEDASNPQSDTALTLVPQPPSRIPRNAIALQVNIDPTDEVVSFHSDDHEEAVDTSEAALGPNASLHMSVTFRHQTEELLTKHRFSDMEGSEIKFREHRDSVVVARSRLSHNGKFSTDPLEQRASVPVIRIDLQDEIANAMIAKWEPLISLDPAIMTSPLPMPYKGSTTPLAEVTDDIWGFANNTPSSTPRRKLSRGHRHIVVEH